KDGTDPRDAFAGTAHVNEGYAQLEEARAHAATGAIPDPVPCEVYCHSLTDPSILGPELRAAGAHTLTCFALHMPARLFPSGEAPSAVCQGETPRWRCCRRERPGRPDDGRPERHVERHLDDAAAGEHGRAGATGTRAVGVEMEHGIAAGGGQRGVGEDRADGE